MNQRASIIKRKLEVFAESKAILACCENTDIIGKALVNTFDSNVPTKLFASALEASNRLN